MIKGHIRLCNFKLGHGYLVKFLFNICVMRQVSYHDFCSRPHQLSKKITGIEKTNKHFSVCNFRIAN